MQLIGRVWLSAVVAAAQAPRAVDQEPFHGVQEVGSAAGATLSSSAKNDVRASA